jgi:Tol biopolymer transport system component
MSDRGVEHGTGVQRLRGWMLLASIAAAAPPAAQAATFEHISHTSIVSPMPPNGESLPVRDSSTDGRYAVFVSHASNLLPGDTNQASDIFLYDALGATLERISVNSNEAQPEIVFATHFPSISGDGDKVVFESCADNLDVNETGIHCGIYLRVRSAGTTALISRSASNVPHLGARPTISRDGRYVAYLRVTVGKGEAAEVVRKDLQSGALDVVSFTPDGAQQLFATPGNPFGALDYFNGGVHALAISADGDKIMFLTDVPLSGANDNDSALDIYLRSMTAATTTLVSVADDESPITQPVWVGGHEAYQLIGSTRWMSSDGQRVLFTTEQALAGNDPSRPGDEKDVYLRDVGAGTTVYVSQNLTGDGGNQQTVANSLSDDGIRAALYTSAFNLHPAGFGGGMIKHLGTQSYTPVAVDPLGNPVCCLESHLHVSGNGDKAFYRSGDSRMLAEDRYAGDDLFKRDLASFDSRVITLPDAAAANQAPYPNGRSHQPRVSTDGNFVAFTSDADNLVPGDLNRARDLFLRDRGPDSMLRLSAGENPAYGGQVYLYDMTPDGRYLVYHTLETLLPEDTAPDIYNVYRYDRQTSTHVLVDRADGSGGAPSNTYVSFATVSADGNRVAFCTQSALTADDLDARPDCYLRDIAAGSTMRLALVPKDYHAVDLTLSDDGTRLGFTSQDDLVAADTNGVPDAYVLHIGVPALQLVSVADGSGGAALGGYLAAMSGDGERTLFVSNAAALNGGNSDRSGVFLRERLSHRTVRVDVGPTGLPLIDQPFFHPDAVAISGDGRYAAFGSGSEGFLEDEGQIHHQLYVRDLDNLNTVRVTPDAGNADGGPIGLALSSDGRWIALVTDATVLIPFDANYREVDTFLTENPLFGEELVSEVDTVTPATVEPSSAPVLSSDARYVAFQSDDEGVLPGDGNAGSDVFRLDTTTGEVVKISLDEGEGELTGDAIEPTLTGNGAMAAFVAPDAAVLKVFGETRKARELRLKSSNWGVFLRNMISGTTQRMGTGRSNPETPLRPGAGTKPAFAPSGKALVFTSDEDRGDLGDSNGTTDVYRVEIEPTGIEVRCVSCRAIEANGSESTEPSNGPSTNPVLSADGSWVAWETGASNPVRGTPDPNPGLDIMIRNMITGTIQRVGQNQGGLGNAGDNRKPQLDYSGRKLVFQSNRSLRPNAPGARNDAYYLDLAQNRLEQISVDALGGQVNGPSFEPTLSGDGRKIAFTSDATNFNSAQPDQNGTVRDVVMHDLRTRISRRLARNLVGVEANGANRAVTLNYTGDIIGFESDATNLSDGDTNGPITDVFLRANPIDPLLVYGSGFE